MDENLLRHNTMARRAQWLLARAERRPTARRVANAARAFEDVLAVMSPDHPDRAACLTNLAAAHMLPVRRRGGSVVPVLVEVQRRVEAEVPDDRPERRTHRLNVRAFLAREAADPERLTSPGHLAPLVEEASAGGPTGPAGADHRDHGAILSERGLELRFRALATDTPELLDEAVDVGRRAVVACPPDHDHYAACLVKLANSLHARYVYRDAAPEVLREALAVFRSGVAAAPEGHPDRASSLNGLAIGLRTQYEATGELDALRDAVAAGRRAVAGSAASPTRASCLTNLSAAAQELFKRTGDERAIVEAVTASREAVALSAPGSRDHAGRSAELANALQILAAGVVGPAARRDPAAAAAPRGAPPEAAVAALREAAAVARSAAAAAAPTGGDRAGRLSTLSIVARTLHELTGDAAALEEARAAGREAVVAAIEGTLAHEAALLAAVRALAGPGVDPATLAELRGLCEALVSTGGPPRSRLLAHLHLGRAAMAASEPRLDVALAAYEYVVGGLPELAPRRLLRADREHGLAELAGLPGEAASVALALDRPEHAVALLERSRGLLFREGTGSRHDLAGLERADPALAAAFVRVREGLDASDQAGVDLYRATSTAAPQGRGRRHQALAAEWDQLLARIRATAGFEDFLSPPSAPVPRPASAGPVVILNVSRHRCDAVTLVPGEPIRVVPLACSEVELGRRADRFRLLAGPGPAGPGEDVVLADLAWLWDHVAAPVLADLDLLSGPARHGEPPALWWCPVGIASFIPWHAAGRHDDAPRPAAVLDVVVSSYTTTIGALRPPAEPGCASPGGGASTLVVDVSRAPGARPLPGAREEARRLHERVAHATVVSGADATRDAVLGVLSEHRFAHFACHALTDPASPTLNRLILHDSATAPLTVAELSTASAPDAELAYLSACSTASTAEHLADEAVHVASAFQLVGFRHVVATLWPIADDAAVEIADDFYARLPARLGPTDIARALHHAVCTLRARHPGTPARWAAHVHIG